LKKIDSHLPNINSNAIISPKKTAGPESPGIRWRRPPPPSSHKPAGPSHDSPAWPPSATARPGRCHPVKEAALLPAVPATEGDSRSMLLDRCRAVITLEKSIGTRDEAGEGAGRRRVVAYPCDTQVYQASRRPGYLIGRARRQGITIRGRTRVSSVSSINAAYTQFQLRP
jgi:hypothetical protein